jgi:hypothetical protein
VNAVIALILLAIIVYVGMTMIPIYSAHYKLEDSIEEDILFARQRFPRDLKKRFTQSVLGYLDEMGVEYDKNNVQIDINSGARTIRVELSYHRDHRIPGFPKDFELIVEGKYGL